MGQAFAWSDEGSQEATPVAAGRFAWTGEDGATDSRPDAKADAVANRPVVPKPTVDVQPLRGVPEMVEGTAKGLYQVSTPGIVTSLLDQRGKAGRIPAIMRTNAAPAQELPNQIAATAVGAMGEQLGEPAANLVRNNVIVPFKRGLSEGMSPKPAPTQPAPAVTPPVDADQFSFSHRITGPAFTEKPPTAVAPIASTASTAKPVIPPPHSEFPPERTMRPLAQPERGRADLLEDKGIQEEMNADLDAHGANARKQYLEGISKPSTPKGELIKEANQARGIATPDKPVKYTKTPGVAIARPLASSAKPVVPAADEDLTPILQKSVEQAKAQRGGAKGTPSTKPNPPVSTPPQLTGDEISAQVFNKQSGPILRNKGKLNTNFSLRDVPVDKAIPSEKDIDLNKVGEYAGRPTSTPPIVLLQDGTVVDGNHRLAAAKQSGARTIRAYVEQSTKGAARNTKK